LKSKKTKNLTIFSSSVGLGSLLFLVIGLMNIDNYINWIQFSVTMYVAGILFGILLYRTICYFVPAAKTYKNTQGIKLNFLLMFSAANIFFGAGTIVNEFSSKEKTCKLYTIESMGESGSRNAYYVFIKNDGKRERLSFGKEFNKIHIPGEAINLCIITGRLGFKYYKVKGRN